MWNRLKEWLLKSEYERLHKLLIERRIDVEHEKDRWLEDYWKRRETLEQQYAIIKQHNDHLMNLLVDNEMLKPISLVINKDSVN